MATNPLTHSYEQSHFIWLHVAKSEFLPDYCFESSEVFGCLKILFTAGENVCNGSGDDTTEIQIVCCIAMYTSDIKSNES